MKAVYRRVARASLAAVGVALEGGVRTSRKNRWLLAVVVGLTSTSALAVPPHSSWRLSANSFLLKATTGDVRTRIGDFGFFALFISERSDLSASCFQHYVINRAMAV
jgi:hypothetical protein